MRLLPVRLVFPALLLSTVYSKRSETISISTSPEPTLHETPAANTAQVGPASSSAASTPSYLSCRPPSPMADPDGFERFIKVCTLLEGKTALYMSQWGMTEKHLRYIEADLPQQLLAIDVYAYTLEILHGCQTSDDQEKPHCTWLAHVRGEISLLLAKMGGRVSNGHKVMDLETLNLELQQYAVESQQIVDDMSHISTKLATDRSSNLTESLADLKKALGRFKKLVERAAGLEEAMGCPEHGLPRAWAAPSMGCPEHGLPRAWAALALRRVREVPERCRADLGDGSSSLGGSDGREG